MKYDWTHYAKLSIKFAKRINTGDETLPDGNRLNKVCDIQDINATAALNRKYAKAGSYCTIHTDIYSGIQEIHTFHSDGSEGIFTTNGKCQGTKNAIDNEVEQYIRGNLGESAKNNKVKLSEQQLQKLIRNCINEVIRYCYI